MADVVARLGVGVHVKMLTCYLSVALLLLAMAVLTLVVISRMSRQVEELTRLQGQLDKARLKTNLITAQLEYRALAFLTDDPSQNVKIDVAKQDFVAAINAAEADSTGEKVEFFRRVRDTSESFDAVGAKVLGSYEAGERDEALEIYLNEELPKMHDVELLMRELVTDSMRQITDARDGFQSDRKLLAVVGWTLSGVSLASALLIGLVLLRGVRHAELQSCARAYLVGIADTNTVYARGCRG